MVEGRRNYMAYNETPTERLIMPKTETAPAAVETVEETIAPEPTKLAKLKDIARNPMILTTAATVAFAGVVLIVKSRKPLEAESEEV